ncbi:hypothetical protein K2173_023878 [Erythroxylum novogranatense]|uniref:Bifunctional inhibitor/plant lipid transfer protein/seed storage helical domain-containing protein n=1 Tax=Erythroxylum novogranatense TaxID=1862640 RepID=A0AAV8TQ50_9ROSI|nr:hypothetical protein K2173_023878 [Erythroxylum novogranatense]
MSSKSLASTTLFLSLSLLFFTLVSSKNIQSPSAALKHHHHGKCPRDTLKFSVCSGIAHGLVHRDGVTRNNPCCNILGPLGNFEAALCLCTAIKANVMGHIIDIPIALEMVISFCGKKVPDGFKC